MNKEHVLKVGYDKFLDDMRNQHQTKQKDPIKVEDQTMKSILSDIVQMPKKLHIVGTPGKVSAKPAKPGENQLQGGAGKDMFK